MFVLGDVVTFKITAAESDNAYFLTEIASLPGSGPAFLHTHVPMETFWILEGEYEVYGQDDDGEKYVIEAPPGSTVHIPGNVPHGFKNAGDSNGRLLALYSPVVHQPEFFAESASLWSRHRHRSPSTRCRPTSEYSRCWRSTRCVCSKTCLTLRTSIPRR